MRLRILKNLVLIFFFVLFANLFWMQIIKGPDYVRQSENNRIRLVPEDASRGIIYDRNRIPLVENELAFDVVAIPQELEARNKNTIFSKLGVFLNVGSKVLADTFSHNFVTGFSPVMLASDVAKETAFLIEQEMTHTSAVFVKTRAKRHYLYSKACAHVLGYVGKMRENEYPEFKKYGYRIKDEVGRSGIERSYDQVLRGKPGGMQLEVDSAGGIIKVLSYRPPVRGNDLETTIDLKLQQLIYGLIGDLKGAACVMDAHTGEILALYSGPTYEPNAMINKKRSSEILEIFRNSDAPLLNRALNAYALGSIFKIVTAYAALTEAKITETTSFDCTGSFKIGNSTRNCWFKKGHGPLNIRRAIATSCNVFFWHTGLKVGERLLSSYSRDFGLGKLTDIDLPGERKGLVPNARWKLSELRQKWYGGDTVNFAIGQGYLLATPLQAVKMVSMVANGGYDVKPHLVKKKQPYKKKLLSTYELNIIRDGMYEVVNSRHGTGKRALVDGVEIYAKTGTAQTGRLESHGWFVGFAKIKQKEICFAVFLEHGGSGGAAPADIAKEIINYLNQG